MLMIFIDQTNAKCVSDFQFDCQELTVVPNEIVRKVDQKRNVGRLFLWAVRLLQGHVELPFGDILLLELRSSGLCLGWCPC
jgi:hypothetical protein